MTMHLAHPSLSLTGKKKGKIKFRTAEAKREYERLAEEWTNIKSRHGVTESFKKSRPEPLTYKLTAPAGRSTSHIPSLSTPGHSTATVHKVYTGTKVKGIATMHKSNAVPVFSDEEAVEISRMRRG